MTRAGPTPDAAFLTAFRAGTLTAAQAEAALPADRGAIIFLLLQLSAVVAGGTGPNRGRFGTLRRDTFRGPAYHDFDFALIKDTPFGHRGNGEMGTVEFRAEFFNLFNVVNFGLPSNIVRGSGFGIISKTAGTSRQIQFSLKVIY